MLRDARFQLQRLYIRNVAGDLLTRREDRVYSDMVNLLLGRDNYTTLQFVHFTVQPLSPLNKTDTLALTIQSRLPDLHSRGLVKVKTYSMYSGTASADSPA